MITQEELKRLLTYDKETGLFKWNISRRCIKAGAKAGCVSVLDKGRKYIRICVNGRDYMAHRLAILYITGVMPSEYVDHINGDGEDNRFVNLRCVSHKENMKNVKLLSNNTSGVCGVTWDKGRSRWMVQIRVNCEQIFLGRFKNKEDAINARRFADIKYGFHKNHGAVRPLLTSNQGDIERA